MSTAKSRTTFNSADDVITKVLGASAWAADGRTKNVQRTFAAMPVSVVIEGVLAGTKLNYNLYKSFGCQNVLL